MHKYLHLLATALLAASGFLVHAQTGVGIGTTAPDASAALDVRSSSQGVLVPRLSQAQRQGIGSPATGLLVYQTDGAQPGFWYYAATGGWTFFNSSADNLGNHTATQSLNLQANALIGTGASIGTAVGLGVRADGGLNLGQNTAGNNVLLGYQAGAATTTGFNNVFGGYQSGYSNTTGSYNLFSGSGSGYANTTGSYNLFSGYRSGFYSTTGSSNTFSGYASGFDNATGDSNVFTGYESGFFNQTGSNNVFTGYQSGYNNTSGSYNLFSGYQTGYNNSTGGYNVFDGYFSGFNNTTGDGNLLSGSYSGYNNTSGSYNLFSGYESGYNNTSGSYNAFDGYFSGQSNKVGSYNTALGYYSGPINGGLTNTLALGNGANVSTSNTIQLGNSNIASLRCQVGLTVTSDARFKYDVQANVPGLAFIGRLRPVSYRFDTERLAAFTRTGRLAAPSAPDPAAVRYSGFLAQDVAQAAQSLGYAFDGVHAPANARDTYGLNYAQFVVPLVRAVQEQQQQLEQLTTQLAHATADLQTLKAQMARLPGAVPASEASASQAHR